MFKWFGMQQEEVNRMVSGHYKTEENKTCDECDCTIGDYIICERVTRCVGCWVEYDVAKKKVDGRYLHGIKTN